MNRVTSTGDNQDLSQLGARLHIPRLLQQVGANPTGRLPKEFGDVQYPERVGPQPLR
jgi:hypothetical protein